MARARTEEGCPGAEDIAAFVRGLVEPARRGTLEAHFARCATCRQLLSALARAAASDSAPSNPSASPTSPHEMIASDAELTFGAQFGRYLVLDWLGAGGMGVVYSAYDPQLNRRIALKVLRHDGGERSDGAPIRDVLLGEAQAMARLAHPNVVTVFDVGSVDDRVFIAMEFVPGQTLAKWMRAAPRPYDEIIAMFAAAGRGLAAAHAAGLIHRDFKPDNVLVGNDGRARVTDFGLAHAAPRVADAAGAGEGGADAPRPAVAGTLAYMAPEQYLRRAVDARADQFSFAVALHEALYGERPFASPPVLPEDRAPDLALATPRGHGVPVAVRQGLSRALSPDPEARHASMTELLATFAPRQRRFRRLAISAGIAVAAAAAVSTGGYALYLRRTSEERIELVSHLRGLAPELRTVLRSAQMLPLHDIRPVRDRVRAAMRDVEHQLQTRAGQAERAVVEFVLGEGHRALGDHDRAVGLLEAAWAGGEREPQIDAALGDALGAAYWSRLKELDDMERSPERDAKLRDIERRYRDPAMAHLRAALAARVSSPRYLQALIAFHEHRFADAARDAGAALAEAPTFYEAGMLEARAHQQAGQALFAANKAEAAREEFVVARRIFQRVLEIARSDDNAWLGYGEMLYAQAHDLASGDLPADLRQQAIDALHTVRQINPERWEPILSEVYIYEHEANLAIVSYRDPRPHVEKVLAMAKQARAAGAPADRVDMVVCLAHWERAVYEGTHGIDPRPEFQQAAAACEPAAAANPDADRYATLGVLYAALAVYDGDHGGEPGRYFELGERNYRASLRITDAPVVHYNLGRLWGSYAYYQSTHDLDPRASVDAALPELEAAVRMDATRSDAVAAIGDVLIARARYEQATQGDARSTIAEARAALARALAIDADLVPPIKYRAELEELEGEALLEQRGDPAPVLAAMRADAELLLRRRPDDRFSHLMSSRTDLLAARRALARGESADRFLTRAASAAARAREADPTDAPAWTTSAEVEQVRAEAAATRHGSPRTALASGLAFIEQALKLDSRLARALHVRDALTRQRDANAGADAARGR